MPTTTRLTGHNECELHIFTIFVYRLSLLQSKRRERKTILDVLFSFMRDNTFDLYYAMFCVEKELNSTAT